MRKDLETGGEPTRYVIPQLENGTFYHVRVSTTLSKEAVQGREYDCYRFGSASTKIPVAPGQFSLAVSDVEATSARLTLRGLQENWSYRRIEPSEGACHVGTKPVYEARAYKGKASLTGLASGTKQRFAAYRDRICSSQVATTPVFLTKPGQVERVHALGMHQSLRITWQAATGADGYELQYRKTGTDAWTPPLHVEPSRTPGYDTANHLENGTRYDVRVRAYADSAFPWSKSRKVVGYGPWSELGQGVPKAGDLVATLAGSYLDAGAERVRIRLQNSRWSASQSWWWKYEVLDRNGTPLGTPLQSACSSAETASAKTADGFHPETRYRFHLYDEANCPADALVSTSTSLLTPPARIRNPAFDSRRKSALLNWSEPPQTTEVHNRAVGPWTTTATGYEIWWGRCNKEKCKETLVLDPANRRTTSATSFLLEGLENDTDYGVLIQACNASGCGLFRELLGVKLDDVALAASDVEATSATLTIGDGLTGNWHHKRTAPAGGACTLSSTGSVSLTGLDSATSHVYAAYPGSDTACAQAELAQAEFLTKPGPVTDFQGTAWQGEVDLSWKPPSGIVSGFRLEWKEAAGNAWSHFELGSPEHRTKTISGLQADVPHDFRIASRNKTGLSTWETLRKTPSGRTRDGLQVEDLGATAATLNLLRSGEPVSSPWWYKPAPTRQAGDQSARDSACTQAGDDNKGYLTGLDPGRTYRYAAYENASCTGAAVLSENFLTKPGKARIHSVSPLARSLEVSWHLLSGQTISGYKVQWRETGAAWSPIREKKVGTKDTRASRITGLDPDTAYELRVLAYNGTGDGAWSDVYGDTDSEKKNTRPSGGPRFGARKVEADSAELYLLYWKKAWSLKQVSPQAQTACLADFQAGKETYSLSGLSPGASYTFAAYEEDGCACKTTGQALCDVRTVLLTKPGKVTGVKASPLHERLHVAWNKPAGQTISGYIVQWKSGTQEYADTRQKTVTSGTAASITGLTNDTAYAIRVRAYNGTGDGAWSDDAAWKDGSAPDGGGPCCTPQAPTLRAKNVEADSATLELDGYVGQWHYKHTTPGSGSCSNAVTAGSTGLSTTSASGLDEGASYVFKAYADSGCTSANELAETTLLTKPGKTTGLTLTSYTQQLNAAWTALSGQTVTGYKIQWKSDQEGENAYDTSRQNTATGSSSSITGLVNGRTYTVRVIAYNGTGDGEASDEATGQPKAVTLTSSNVEAATATLTIAYHVGSWYYKRTVPESGSCSESAVTGTSIGLTGLNGNTNYIYKAYSSSGCASDAELATAPTFLTKPGKPTKPTATAGSGSGKLTITSSVTGSGALTKWQYKQKEGTGGFDADWTDISSTSTNLSHTITGLTDGTDYQYKVRAANATGDSAESDASTAARPLDETLTASSVETTTATLALGNYTGNWYYKYTSPTGGTCAANAVTTSTKDLTELAGNTTYTYKAYSESTCTTELASETFLTKPGKPTRPTATPGAGSGKLTLKASITGDGTPTKWQYKQKKGTGNYDTDWTDISNSASTSLNHTLSGLTDGTKYRYKVRAVNATGNGVESDESAEATPADEALSASSVEATTATLTLGNYTGNWWLKRTTPADDTCKSKGTTTTEDLSSLPSNTSHTYKAYSDSSCTTELASETFLTKPGKPAKPGASPGAGSGKLTLTASVSGSGTLEKWQYKQKEGTGNFDADWTDVSSTSTSLSHVVSGLTDGTDYQYKVRAKNASGFGAESDPSTAAQPLDETLTVSAITATGATLTLANWNSSWWLKRTAPADTTCKSKGTTYTEDLDDLSSNTDYTYKAYSDSGCTTELTSKTFLTKPGKPAKPVATAGAGSGKLTLTASVSGSGTLTKWQYKQKKGTNNFDDDWTDIQSTSTSLSHTITGLTDGTDYQYKVRARNATGDGAESDASTAAQPLDETLTASSVEAATATLTIGNYTGNWWLKRTTPADTACKSKSTTATEDLTTLSSNTSYTYKAYSDNACTTELATETFLTKPGKPAKPTATAGAGSGKLTITSSVTGDGTLTRWQYKQKEGTGDFDDDWTDISSTSTSLSHTITGLDDGTDYQYKVRAKNATGEGAESDASTAAQPADETLTASSITATGATLTIGNYTGSWHYKYTAPTGGTCSSSAVTQTSATVSDLDSNTAYTFKAYSDSTCATELAAAAAFPTLPPKPAKPTATAGAGSGKLTLAASVTGTATLSQWQYQQKEDSGEFGSWTDIQSTSTSLSHVVSGLTDGNSYQFKVRAANASGNGAESDASTAAQPLDETLTASSVEATTATLTLGNYSGEWYYKYTSPNGGSCSSSAVTGSTASLTDLSSNTSYTFKAYSDNGCTTANLLASASAFLTKPGKPTKPQAEAGTGSRTLVVTASVSGSGTLTKWQYKQKKGTGNFDADWTDISSTQASLSHTITGLTDGTNYQYKVRTVNATGFGAESDASTAVQPLDETLTVSNIEATTATLTIANWGKKAWHYKADAAPDTACTSAGTDRAKDLTGLQTATAYVYAAYEDSSCSASKKLATADSFTTKPGKVTGLTLTSYSQELAVSWTARSGTVTGYKVQWKSGAQEYNTTRQKTVTSGTQTTITNLADDTEYTVRVTAYNGTGDGAPSDEAKGTPKAVTLAASALEDTTATLTIAYHPDAWYYKQQTPSAGTCQGPVAKGTKTAALTSLTPATSHVYKAYSDSGCTTTNLLATTSSFLTKPGQVANVTLTPYTGQMDVSWNAYSGTISGYRVEWKAGKDSWSSKDGITSNKTTLTGLRNNAAYTVRVTAYNATGNGTPSATASATPKAVALKAKDVEATTATLAMLFHRGKWWYAPFGKRGPANCTAVTGSTSDLTGLTPATRYGYMAYTTDQCHPRNRLPVGAQFLTKPGKVDWIKVKPLVDGLEVRWRAVGGILSGYKIQWKSGNQDWNESARQRAAPRDLLVDTIPGLEKATLYTVRVMAYNDTGNGASSPEWSGSVLGAAALGVINIHATAAELVLTGWNEAWYYKSDTSPHASCSDAVTGLNATALTGLIANTDYVYKAYEDSGCSTGKLLATAPSFPTLPGKPTQPTATAGGGSGQLVLAAGVSGTAAITKWQYKQKKGTDAWDDDWTDISSTSTALIHTLTGLDDGTEYRYKVRAFNASGAGEASDESDVNTGGSPPKGVPTEETLEASDVTADSATLTLKNYSGSWWLKRTTPASTTCKSKGTTDTESLSSLGSNSSYTYKAYSDSSCATELASETFLTKPGKPTKPTATAGAGSGKLTLASSIDTGKGTVEKWQYQQKRQQEGGGNWGEWQDIASTSTTLSHVVSGLTDEARYQFKVRAENATGFGAESDASDIDATGNPPKGVPKDETLTVSDITATGATLTLGYYTGDWHYKHTTPSNGDCSASAVTETTAAVSDLSSNTDHVFKAYSNSGCSTELAAASAFPTLPPKPSKPIAAAGAGSGKLTLTATVAGGNATLTGWQYRQKKGSGNYGDWQEVSQTTKSLNHTITGLTDGTSYRFKVRAKNASGPGETSDESDVDANGNPPKGVPQDESLEASDIEASTATLTLSGHAGSWWLKRTTPADTTCKSKGTTYDEDLDDLSSNTNYTYKAYSNSDCSTELATGTFLTKPGKPEKPTAAAGGGSGKLTLTSSVTGSGALTGWKYLQKVKGTNWGSNWTSINKTSKSLSHEISGLTDGTQYVFKVKAVNATGESVESEESQTTNEGNNGIPKDETLSVSNLEATTLTLTIGNWKRDWYYKYTAPGGGSCSSKVAAGTTTADVNNLATNTSHTFKAYSNAGCSEHLASASPALTKPGKPATPQVTTRIGSGKLKIAASVTGDGALTQWEYKQKEGNSPWDSDWTSVSSTATSFSTTLSGLTDETDYRYKVRAKNETGYGAESDASSATKPAAAALTASPVEAASATLTLTSWNGSWWLKQTTPASTTCKSKGTTYTESLSSLDSNSSYTYKAYSDSSCATELASETFLTKPGKPTRPTATAGSGSGQLTLAASVSGSETLTKWQYKQKKNNGTYGSWQDVSSTSTTLSHVVSGLTNGARYRFKVRAENTTGYGAESDPSEIDANSNPPKGIPKDETLAVSNITASGVTLTLSNYASSWYYKQTTPSGGTCSDAVTGVSDSVTGLAANTDHVFKAYSDAACKTEIAVSRTFPTLPPKPSRPAATGGAGSGKLTLTSSVTGSAALTKWEYQHKKAADSAWSNWTEVTTASTSLNHTASGFTDGTAYAFRVRATNASGTGAISDASATDGGKGTPRAITLAASKVEAESATLTLENWTGDWWLKRTIPASTACTSKSTAYTEDLSGLDTNTSHTYGAYSESGCSTRLAEETFLTKPGKPVKPTATPGAGSGKLTLVSSVTGSGVLVKWQYKQKKGTDAWDDDWTDIASTSASLHHVISGLTDDTDYRYKTRAVNATGESEESDVSDASQPGERTLSASDVEATTATLTLGNHTGDWWLKRTTPASSACTSKGAAYTENLQDLPSNTHHAYGAYDASACEVSIAVAVFLTKPGKPTRPDVSNGNGSGKLAVSASVNGQGRLTKWQYKKKAENAAWDDDWTDADGTQTTLNHTVENLADGTRYQFKVRAWNATGAGEESEPSLLDDDATPLDEVLSVSAITTEGATLTLSNYAGSWRHKRTTPAGGACSALAFETPDTAVSGLAANTLHAYAAYADAACDTELAVSRTFPTLPPKPAKPEARSGAGSGKLTLTSHINGGNAALAKWQVQQQEENDDWSQWQDVRQTAFSLVHLVEDLTDGKRYRFGSGSGTPRARDRPPTPPTYPNRAVWAYH